MTARIERLSVSAVRGISAQAVSLSLDRPWIELPPRRHGPGLDLLDALGLVLFQVLPSGLSLRDVPHPDAEHPWRIALHLEVPGRGRAVIERNSRRISLEIEEPGSRTLSGSLEVARGLRKLLRIGSEASLPSLWRGLHRLDPDSAEASRVAPAPESPPWLPWTWGGSGFERFLPVAAGDLDPGRSRGTSPRERFEPPAGEARPGSHGPGHREPLEHGQATSGEKDREAASRRFDAALRQQALEHLGERDAALAGLLSDLEQGSLRERTRTETARATLDRLAPLIRTLEESARDLEGRLHRLQPVSRRTLEELAVLRGAVREVAEIESRLRSLRHRKAELDASIGRAEARRDEQGRLPQLRSGILRLRDEHSRLLGQIAVLERGRSQLAGTTCPFVGRECPDGGGRMALEEATRSLRDLEEHRYRASREIDEYEHWIRKAEQAESELDDARILAARTAELEEQLEFETRRLHARIQAASPEPVVHSLVQAIEILGECGAGLAAGLPRGLTKGPGKARPGDDALEACTRACDQLEELIRSLAIDLGRTREELVARKQEATRLETEIARASAREAEIERELRRARTDRDLLAEDVRRTRKALEDLADPSRPSPPAPRFVEAAPEILGQVTRDLEARLASEATRHGCEALALLLGDGSATLGFDPQGRLQFREGPARPWQFPGELPEALRMAILVSSRIGWIRTLGATPLLCLDRPPSGSPEWWRRLETGVAERPGELGISQVMFLGPTGEGSPDPSDPAQGSGTGMSIDAIDTFQGAG